MFWLVYLRRNYGETIVFLEVFFLPLVEHNSNELALIGNIVCIWKKSRLFNFEFHKQCDMKQNFSAKTYTVIFLFSLKAWF